jgi:STE24 endopeptidase
MNPYLILILGILMGAYLLDAVVAVLNARHAKPDLPEEFVGYYPADRYRRSQEYLKENTRFKIISNTVFSALVIAFILLGGFQVVDQFARGFELGPVLTGLIFAGAILLVAQLVQIPFSIYDTFVIEERYGFNRTTPKTFFLDILKVWALVAVIGGVAFSVVLWVFQVGGSWAWAYCWAAVTLFQILITFVAPVVILPLFNKFTPLESGSLRQAIQDYAGSQDFKQKGIFTMDGSRRSAKTNAFFTGFGRFRRIVLFDTLMERHAADEIVAILAHEMGHHKNRHILKSTFLSILTTGLMFFFLSFFINNQGLFSAFRMEETSIYASLFFFGFLYAPMDMVLSVFGNALSRRHEYQADAYVVRTYERPQSLIRALKKLSVENLVNLTPHPLTVFLTFSHPPVLERIKAIEKQDK